MKCKCGARFGSLAELRVSPTVLQKERETMLNPDNATLEWCAKWIEDSLRAETNERTVEFGKNMAMTIRAVKTKDSATAPPTQQEGEQERRRLTRAELDDIERFQRQRRKNPVSTDAWLYVAEIDRLLVHVRADPAPLCPVHADLEDADRLELQIGNDCVACSLNEHAELLTILEPFAKPDGTQDSVTVLLNAISVKCARCNGTGEVEGYGGNNVSCGHCAGTGKRPRFAAAPSDTAGPKDDDYVAWLRYVNHGQEEDSGTDIITIEVCDSDAPGAFKVYTRVRGTHL